MNIKYNSIEELKMQCFIASVLSSIPNDYRSRNHTLYLEEVNARILELSEKNGGAWSGFEINDFVDEAMELMPDIIPFINKPSILKLQLKTNG